MAKTKLPWEMEIAEVGFLHNAARQMDEGIIDRNAGNFWVDFIMGFGGQPATPRQLVYMVEEAHRLFPNTRWEDFPLWGPCASRPVVPQGFSLCSYDLVVYVPYRRRRGIQPLQTPRQLFRNSAPVGTHENSPG